jgi:DeoR family transcriptional regulator, fructose operon transcriptional repressor
MYAAERQALIVELVRQDGRVSVTGLADQLSVASETIRRDLAALERKGLIQRVHGGAIAVQSEAFEPTLEARSVTMTAEKERIGKAAVAEVPHQGSIFIEAGNTSSYLVAAFPQDRVLTVVTNAPGLALPLAAMEHLTVICIGGRVRGRTMACVDDLAVQSLSDLHVNVAFVGTNGVVPAWGLTTPDASEAAVKRIMLHMAERTILLADHSKFGVRSLFRYGDVSDLDVVITDSGISEEQADELRAAGPWVIAA